MREWTEQEEQQIIAQARQGDPKANYELSLWALRRSEEEPEEERWNRLAAKCLVKAAQAGYGPAQERMAELLHSAGAGSAPTAGPRPVPKMNEEPDDTLREPVRLSDARQARRGQGPAPESTARRVRSAGPESTARRAPEPEEEYEEEEPRFRRSRPVRRPPEEDRWEDDLPQDAPEDDYDGYEDEPSVRGGGQGAVSRWGEGQWKRLEIICVAVCAILLVAIAVMIITSRHGTTGGSQSTIPPAGDASAAATTSPEPAADDYPPDDVIKAIENSELEIKPDEGEYVTVPTSATVNVESTSLRLRTGPNTEYKLVTSMPDETVVDVYANKNDWSLVYYKDAEDGPVYGWCSSEYLFINTGAANTGGVG